jgi:hypothetical protein
VSADHDDATPPCPDCWMAAVVSKQHKELQSAWNQLNDHRVSPRPTTGIGSVLVLLILVAFVTIVLMTVTFAVGPRLDQHLVAPGLGEVVSQQIPLEGKESVVLEREGAILRMYVVYDGSVRGQLLKMDLAAKVLTVPARPPAGFSIGGL